MKPLSLPSLALRLPAGARPRHVQGLPDDARLLVLVDD